MSICKMKHRRTVWWLPTATYEYQCTMSGQELIRKVRVALDTSQLQGKVAADGFRVYYSPRSSRDGYYNAFFAVYIGKVKPSDLGCDILLSIRPNVVASLMWWLIACFMIVWECVAVLVMPLRELAAAMAMGFVGFLLFFVLLRFVFWRGEEKEHVRVFKHLFE